MGRHYKCCLWLRCRRKAAYIFIAAERPIHNPLNPLNLLNPLNPHAEGVSHGRYRNPRPIGAVKPENPPAEGRLNLRTLGAQGAIHRASSLSFIL